MKSSRSYYMMTVKELREKSKMIKAILPLVTMGIWTDDEFNDYCDGILSGEM